jgi:hypothetical protein
MLLTLEDSNVIEDSGPLGRDTALKGKWFPGIQRKALPSSSNFKYLRALINLEPLKKKAMCSLKTKQTEYQDTQYHIQENRNSPLDHYESLKTH